MELRLRGIFGSSLFSCMSGHMYLTEEDFIQVYEEQSDALFRHVYFRIFDRNRSKELLTEAFKRLWLFVADGNAVDSPKSFLYRALDALIELDVWAGIEERIPDVEDEQKKVFQVMGQLSRSDRRTVVMHYIDGFSAQEISDIVGGTVVAHAAALESQKKLLATLIPSTNNV
jgi:DNA-directed RNA polymerase specialized sigma24 family protein